MLDSKQSFCIVVYHLINHVVSYEAQQIIQQDLMIYEAQ